MQHFDSSHRPAARQKTTKQASIVVVDPDPLSLIATAGVLHTQGYNCTCARTSEAALRALEISRQDLVIWDVADDAVAAIEALEKMRKTSDYEELPAILIAESRWSGLETKTEAMSSPTRCLFKPIDPNSLFAVVDHVLWMPTLIATHRRKGSTPRRNGWVTL